MNENSAAAVRSVPMTASGPEQNEALLQAPEAALNERALDTLAALHTDEVLHRGVRAPKADLMWFWTDIVKTFPDYHVTIDRLFAEDDWVIELMALTGTHLGRAQAHLITAFRLVSNRQVSRSGFSNRTTGVCGMDSSSSTKSSEGLAHHDPNGP